MGVLDNLGRLRQVKRTLEWLDHMLSTKNLVPEEARKLSEKKRADDRPQRNFEADPGDMKWKSVYGATDRNLVGTITHGMILNTSAQSAPCS